MIQSGEFDLTKAGTQTFKVKYLGTVKEFTINVSTYALVETTVPVRAEASTAAALKLVVNGGEPIDVTADMITGTVDFTKVGEYKNVKVTYGDASNTYTINVVALDEYFAEGTMIYSEDFSGLKADMTSAEIFKALGWKNLYKGSVPAANAEIGLAGSQSNSTIVLAAGANGTLDLTNSGARSFMQLLSADFMSLAAQGDYSVSFDLTLKADSKWVTLMPRYRSNLAGKFTGTSTVAAGTKSFGINWRLGNNGLGNPESPADIQTTASGKHDAGEMIRVGYVSTVGMKNDKWEPQSKSYMTWWGYRALGWDKPSTNFIAEKTITIVMQIINADSDFSYIPTVEELGDLSKMTE
jgi:hypothetical protein